MPTVSVPRRELVSLPSFVTYGATPTYSVASLLESSRSRSWTRGFKNTEAMRKSLLANGYLPTLPYTDDLQETVRSKLVTFSGQLYADPASTYAWAIIPGTPRTGVNVDTDPDVAASLAKVLGQLQSRISGHGTNLLVSAAEARQTVGMIGDAALKLAHAYRRVKRGKFLDAASMLGLPGVPRRVNKKASVMNNWLEYRYGWRLVVMDASSLMKTLYDSLTLRPPLLRVTAKDEGTMHRVYAQGVQQLFMPNGVNIGSYTLTKDVVWDWSVRGGYVYQLESVPLATGQSFGLTNPATFAWEIIPYSFVVDWFTNVGSVLEGLTAFQGKTCKDGWIAKYLESRTTYKWSGLTKSSSVVSMKCSALDQNFGPVKERRFSRVGTTFVPASLRLDVDLNVSRVIDAVSLIKQRLR